MLARIVVALSVLLLGVSALAGVSTSGADFTHSTQTQAVVTADADWTPPTVTVVDPGFVVSGTVELAATAADDHTTVATVEIQFRAQGATDWTSLCVASSSPWICTWVTTSVVDGVYELRAIATDIEANTETSDLVTTEVYNTAGVVIDPVPSPTRGTVVLTARIVNATGTTSITFQGAVAGSGNWTNLAGCSGPGPEASCSYDTTMAPSGTYDLRAVGTAGGNTYYDVQPNIVVDNTAPAVTINQASGQADPTNGSTIEFTAVFSEAVTGFDAADVVLGGTAAGSKTATVTGSGTTYSVAVTGATGDGIVTATIPAGGATDAAGNSNLASTSTDNSVRFEGPTTNVTIDQYTGQADPTNGATIYFVVAFSKPVTGFATGDVTISGTAGGIKLAAVTPVSATSYYVAVTGMTSSGTVVASIPAGVAVDAYGNPTEASTSTDNSVTVDLASPTVTIDQAAGQADPSNGSTINFTVVFSEPVTAFATGDVTITGTTSGTKVATVTGSGTTYNVAVTGMTSSGTVIATVAAGSAMDLAGNSNLMSTSTDNSVTRDVTAPTVTVNQAVGQADPTTGSTINFTVVFSEPVTGFETGDVTLTGQTVGTKVGTVTGSGTTYNVAVTGMTGDGTVIATIEPGKAVDAVGNANVASTRTDNTVTYNDTIAPTVTVNQAVGQADPTNGPTIEFTVVFSEQVNGLAAKDLTLTSTASGAKISNVTATGNTTYSVMISGMTGAGTVKVSLAANKVDDYGRNGNVASTSTDNQVDWLP